MRTTLLIASLTAMAALALTGSFSSSYAASCEAQLKPSYKCTASLDDGQSTEYCLRPDVEVPGDGKFWMVEAEVYGIECTCEAKGRAPNLDFGGSSRDFFCSGYPNAAFIGRVSGSRITGQGYNADWPPLRSTFTCQAVATCP